VSIGIGNQHKGAVAALALILASTAALEAQTPVRLATVVELAQRNSAPVRLAEADVSKAQGASQESNSAFVPSLNFASGLPFLPSVGFMGGTPNIFTGSLQSMVFSMPQREYIRAAQDGVRTAMLSLKNSREQVALDASTAYIELDTVTQLDAASAEEEKLANDLVRIEEQRTEAGVDPLSYLLEAKLTAAQLHLKRLHLKTRTVTLEMQLAALTGLPAGSITTEHASIPEIPASRMDKGENAGVASALMMARSKQRQAKGDSLSMWPQMLLSMQYARETTLLNNANSYYAHPLKGDNFSSGFQIELPLFDRSHRAKVKQSAAEALRATVEAEQARNQNDIQISMLTETLNELDTRAEIAQLKQQIASEQIKSIETEMELGNPEPGSANAPVKQLSPKDQQLAKINERQKFEESLDAGFDLARTRLSLLRALGHMEEWIRTLGK